MIPIYYKSSEGVVINLIETPYRMLTDTDLLNSKWTPVTAGTNNPKIVALKQEQQSPPFSIRVTGQTKEEMYNNLEHIEGVFDRDCFLGQMGRLYIGDFYRECFITSSTKEKVFEKESTTVQYVATSNDGFWTNDKDFTLSGYGMPTGEIAYTVTPYAIPNNEQLEWFANADKTASISWSGGYGTKKSLMFDLGEETTIGRFRGIHLTSQGTPISCNVQTWDGTYNETSDSIDCDTLTQEYPTYAWSSDAIEIDHTSWNKIQVDSTSLDTDIISVSLYCMKANQRVITQTIWTPTSFNNTPIDVSGYDSVKFVVQAFGEIQDQHSEISYTIFEEDWQTIDTYSVSSSTVEVDISDDFTTRYVRLYSPTYLGIIEDDAVSFISGSELRPRDLFGLGYSTENLEVIPYDDDSGRVNFKLLEVGKGGYLYFDAQSFILKKITSSPRSASSDGSIAIWGENDGEWELILDLESASEISEDFNTHYDRIRLAFSPLATDHLTQNFTVMAEADPVIYNESYAPSDAIIEIEGQRNNPQISIGGVVYGANIELAEGHRLQINTVEHTVRDYSSEYAYSNVYASRTENCFEKIDSGENEVYWDGQQSVKIKLFQQRSTPKWN